jgi:hypothetical protein
MQTSIDRALSAVFMSVLLQRGPPHWDMLAAAFSLKTSKNESYRLYLSDKAKLQHTVSHQLHGSSCTLCNGALSYVAALLASGVAFTEQRVRLIVALPVFVAGSSCRERWNIDSQQAGSPTHQPSMSLETLFKHPEFFLIGNFYCSQRPWCVRQRVVCRSWFAAHVSVWAVYLRVLQGSY